MLEFLSGPAIAAFFQVIMIDLVLAGDNAVVIGLAAAGLPADQRNRAILIGIIAATVLRIAFATVTAQLLQIVGLLLAGGILLLWVCWKMWREIRHGGAEEDAAAEVYADQEATAEASGGAGSAETDSTRSNASVRVPRKTFSQAAWQIVVADVSMSLDNVLAVAGAAREHPYILVFGLALSIALMGLAASFIARLLQRYHWISYVGLVIILYVALEMVYRGALEVWPAIGRSMGT